MIPKIRKDNSFHHNWAIRWNGDPEDFSEVTDINLTAIVIGQHKKLEEGTHYTIAGNIIRIDFTPSICNRIGVYKLELKYKKPSDDFIDGERRSAVDLNAFEIVPDSAHADVTQDISVTSDAVAGFALKYEHLTPEQKEELRGKGIKSLSKTSESDEGKTYTITFDDDETFNFIVKDGHSPVITFNGTNIVVDEELGPDLKGETGNGISSVEFIKRVGLVKEYAIIFTDGNTTSFFVADGADGHSPVITFNGTNIVVDEELGPDLKGETGKGVSSVTLHSTAGLSKTYRITFTDNSTFDYIVMDGAAGAGAQVEQERSQALDKVPSSKLFDDEMIQLAGDVTQKMSNVVVNGDMSEGTTGWSPNASTNSVVGGLLLNTGNGAISEPNTYTIIGAKVVGNKYYARAEVTAKSALCNRVRMLSSDLFESNNTIVANIKTVLSGVITASSTYGNIIIYHNYPTAANANNAVLEIDNVICVNLTQWFGAGHEPTKSEMNTLISIIGIQYFGGEITITAKQIMKWQLKMIRENRAAIIALGGTII